MSERAMEGTKVVEWCQMVTGPYCGKLIADLGAEVIKIEPPRTGDAARFCGPYPEDIPHRERSGLFLYCNTNKLGITLEVTSATGREIFKKLVSNADILIEDRPPGAMEEIGLGYGELRNLNPGLIMVSITPFGQTGPHRHYKMYHLNLIHGAGGGYLTPNVTEDSLHREPLKGGGRLDEFSAGLSAALGALAALYCQGLTGLGQHLDISKQQAVMDLDRVHVATWANTGRSPERTGRPSGSQIYRCMNGFVVISPYLDHMWQGLVDLMGRPQWALHPKFDGQVDRDEHAAELSAGVQQWVAGRTVDEVYHGGQSRGCPVGIVRDAADLARCAQYRARGFFVEVDHPEAGGIQLPSCHYQFSETPWAGVRPAPLLG
ncbi:MAG: CoA transferase, partial [Dehalococcoidia bacterium]|nr:CoA transferase [Dehalococcoidia bacterium]